MRKNKNASKQSVRRKAMIAHLGFWGLASLLIPIIGFSTSSIYGSGRNFSQPNKPSARDSKTDSKTELVNSEELKTLREIAKLAQDVCTTEEIIDEQMQERQIIISAMRALLDGYKACWG